MALEDKYEEEIQTKIKERDIVYDEAIKLLAMAEKFFPKNKPKAKKIAEEALEKFNKSEKLTEEMRQIVMKHWQVSI